MQSKKIKKLYYSIREVSEHTGVEQHVLRFWEKEFSQLRPKRGRSGNRAYTARDLKVILAIKDLLYVQKYTIQGAVEQLKKDPGLWKKQSIEAPEKEDARAELRDLLLDLKRLIEGDANSGQQAAK